jgi:TM2 domain-containing membrane protein YozV
MLKDASSYFLKSNYEKNTTKWFNAITKNTSNNNFNLIYKASICPKAYAKENFPLELQKSFSKYKCAYLKKPLAAAFFSTILPGSGKLYAGKTKTFFLTFLLNAAYGVQTVESTQKLGIKNPLSIINVSAFTVFYLSNIYGSYKAVIDLRKERKKQFINDATNFYN